jgi:hypothetical protein
MQCQALKVKIAFSAHERSLALAEAAADAVFPGG